MELLVEAFLRLAISGVAIAVAGFIGAFLPIPWLPDIAGKLAIVGVWLFVVSLSLAVAAQAATILLLDLS